MTLHPRFVVRSVGRWRMQWVLVERGGQFRRVYHFTFAHTFTSCIHRETAVWSGKAQSLPSSPISHSLYEIRHHGICQQNTHSRSPRIANSLCLRDRHTTPLRCARPQDTSSSRLLQPDRKAILRPICSRCRLSSRSLCWSWILQLRQSYHQTRCSPVGHQDQSATGRQRS